MSSIKGKKRETTEDFTLKLGMVEVNVIAVNPSFEEYETILGIELKEESKAANYMGESKDGNNYTRVDFWMRPTEEVEEGTAPLKFKVSFFLEDKNRMNKDETKQQYINNIGICSWAADEDTLPPWFAKRDYRNAKAGEEDFYGFLRSWIEIDYREDDSELELDWKAIMKGDLTILRDLIGEDLATPFIAMATVSVKGEGEDMKMYQGIYNKGFLPSYTMRHFNLVDYNDPAIQGRLAAKVPKDLKAHERFVKNATGDYGCKDIFSLKPLSEFIESDHIMATDETKMEGDASDAAGPSY